MRGILIFVLAAISMAVTAGTDLDGGTNVMVGYGTVLGDHGRILFDGHVGAVRSNDFTPGVSTT